MPFNIAELPFSYYLCLMPQEKKQTIISKPLATSGKRSAKFYVGGNLVGVLMLEVKGELVTLSGQTERYRVPKASYFDIYKGETVKLVEPPILYESKMEMVELAQEGVKANTIKRLAELLGISIAEAAEFFHFSERTLRDYVKKDKLLDPDSSEKVLKIFSLYLFGYNVLEGSENFIKWLYQPSFGLRDKIPATLLYSSDGIDLVHDELARIEHGDLS